MSGSVNNTDDARVLMGALARDPHIFWSQAYGKADGVETAEARLRANLNNIRVREVALKTLNESEKNSSWGEGWSTQKQIAQVFCPWQMWFFGVFHFSGADSLRHDLCDEIRRYQIRARCDLMDIAEFQEKPLRWIDQQAKTTGLDKEHVVLYRASDSY